MPYRFDGECLAAIELAKKALPEGAHLDIEKLLQAVYHGTQLREKLPDMQRVLESPKPIRERTDLVPLTEELKEAISPFATRTTDATPPELFASLVASQSGKEFLIQRGMSEPDVAKLLAELGQGAPEAESGASPAEAPDAKVSWRDSPERREAVEALSAFGRMLTDMKHPRKDMVEIEGPIHSILTNLSRWRNRSTIIVGFPGTGKTALVYELARRLVEGHSSIPPRLRDIDIFELSPSFLRAGASVVGQYDERVKSLIQVLQAHPKIILFVDEVHSLFQSGMHERGPFSEANESFKGPVARGDITIIGCTTLAEFRHYIAPDKALSERFSPLRLEPPSRDAALRMLQARRPQIEQSLAALRVPDPILTRVIDLTEDYFPGHFQPRKSLQVLDEACAWSAMSDPPLAEVTEEALLHALENKIGHSIARPEHMTVEDVQRQLQEKVVGQEDVLHQVAEAFVAGLSPWAHSKGPRAAFVFGGPTGVGKTESARRLGEILGGGGEEKMIRVDCNTIQGSGFDSGPAINRLIGVPPGYVGYSRGQGGILCRIRDYPECVVLFDEFEKADPGVGKLLLQILEEGRVEDVDGNMLDFRRSFVIFTTNAGCTYEGPPSMVFSTGKQAVETPSVEMGLLLNELRAVGHGEEFFGRIDYFCLFRPLDGESIQKVVEMQLDGLRRKAHERGLALEWEDGIVQLIARQWKPHFGVRALQQILRNRVLAQLGVAESQGEMVGVTKIRLERMDRSDTEQAPKGAKVHRFRRGDVLVVALS